MGVFVDECDGLHPGLCWLATDSFSNTLPGGTRSFAIMSTRIVVAVGGIKRLTIQKEVFFVLREIVRKIPTAIEIFRLIKRYTK